MKDRLLCTQLQDKVMTAEQAAQLVHDNDVVATSGFSLSGYPKAVPLALSERANRGDKVGITLIAGASVGDELDGALARSGVIKRRFPFQSNSDMRQMINRNEIAFADMHLSQISNMMKKNIFGAVDVGIIEVAAVGENGELYPTTSVSISNTVATYANKIILEINTSQSLQLIGTHDIYDVKPIPHTEPIPIVTPEQRIGRSFLSCDINKIEAIVYTNIPDQGSSFMEIKPVHQKMAQFFIEFIQNEVNVGRLPMPLPPFQSGIGGVANAVLSGLVSSDWTDLSFYSEVIQDAVLDLIDCGKLKTASATAFSLTGEGIKRFQENAEIYAKHLVFRPVNVSNSAEVIQRLGVIAMNTAVECDIYGNINSTHVAGTKLINGIGGSGDYARNAGMPVFFTESTAKNMELSCIVPFCTHIDHTEHDVQVLITEQGVADLRGLSPIERAQTIIENCAHPKFKAQLFEYLEEAKGGHIVHNFSKAFALNSIT